MTITILKLLGVGILFAGAVFGVLKLSKLNQVDVGTPPNAPNGKPDHPAPRPK